ncbi:hypothetical protein NEIPOLOT_01017 [Neisseria polysaccharea ATCC 43768]|nr:hypothetical protein NEIPOLOT_01017 [Neisseria polysaccharea ATCC 43768]
MGFSPPKQRQAATTVKQRQVGRWAEAHPTADTTVPHSAEACGNQKIWR